MDVKKLVCDVCGGQIEMQSGGKGTCTSCGTPYSADIMKEKIQEIKGTVKIEGAVETVNGDAEKERLLNMANNCFSKGNLEEARRIYKIVSQDYSNDWRGWWGIICATPINYVDIIGHEKGRQYLTKEFEMAISFAPKTEEKRIIEYKEKRYLEIERVFYENIINELKKRITGNNDPLLEKLENEKNKHQNTIDRSRTRKSIGWLLIVIAVLLLIFFYNMSASTANMVIGILMGVIGGILVFWDGSAVGDSEFDKNKLDRAISSLQNYKNKCQEIEDEIKTNENKLKEINEQLLKYKNL